MRSAPILAALTGAVLVAVAPSFALADPPAFDPDAARARVEVRLALSSMEGTASHLRSVLRDARSSRDKGKIACADDALTRADVSHRQAKTHAAVALDAFAGGHAGEAHRELGLVRVLRDAVRDARVRGDSCAVRPAYDLPSQRDTTVVRVYVEPRVPPRDP